MINSEERQIQTEREIKIEYDENLSDIAKYVKEMWVKYELDDNITGAGCAPITSEKIHTERVTQKFIDRLQKNHFTEIIKHPDDDAIMSNILTDDFGVPTSQFHAECLLSDYLGSFGCKYEIFRQYQKSEGILGFIKNWFLFRWDYKYVLVISRKTNAGTI